MKITLVVLAGLTIYCKCAAVLSLPPSPLIADAASLDESSKIQKPFADKDNESLHTVRLAREDATVPEEERTLPADLYTNFKNFWHNDLSLNLQKREQRNTFDDIDGNAAALQHTMATIKQNNQNQNGLQPQDIDNDNANHKNYNHNNDNKNENYILKSYAASSLPLWQSSAATNLNLKIKPQSEFSAQKINDNNDDDDDEDDNDSGELLSSYPEMSDYILVTPPHQIHEPLHPKRRELENVPLAAPADDSPVLNRFLKSSNYWSRPCTLENENNCLQEYYGALIADRNNVLLEQLQQQKQKHNYPPEETVNPPFLNNNIRDDDIVLLLTAEQSLLKFLRWALSELSPYGNLPAEGDNGTNYYHPGMYAWRKLSLSGRLEPPLLVEEPHYVQMRRDYDRSGEDIEFKRGLNYGEDPFIPPRGRKHNLPDLDSLLQRYETFVPNRGRRDKIKDIFKHDDLFYPNRGKRQMTTAANDNGDTDERSDSTVIENIKEIQQVYNNKENAERHEMQHPLLSNEQLIEYIENLMMKMKRKLYQQPEQQRDEKLANSFDEMSNRNEPPTGMSSTHKQPPLPLTSPSLSKKSLKSMINILYNRKKSQQQKQYLPNHCNARRQWCKRYTATKTSSTKPAIGYEKPMPAIRSPTMATNRLQTTLPLQKLYLQQQQQQQTDFSPAHVRLYNSKFMWQQLPKSIKSLALHVDPLSWYKLQLQQQKQQQQEYHQPLLTVPHPRLTALQHLPTLQHQSPKQLPQLATPQEAQLTNSYDQIDDSTTNDLDNVYNKVSD